MADPGNKKRKRDGDAVVKPKKKVAIDGPPAAATVSSVLRPKFLPPVIASSSGIHVPTDTVFQSYRPKDQQAQAKRPKNAAQAEILLHSTEHRSLDYTAREENARGTKPLLHHYVGVYDPKTGKLQVVEAKKMSVRGVVRAKQASSEAMGERDARENMLESRTNLVNAFGARKAKKALQEKVMNAIATPRKPGDTTRTVIDDAARAIIDTVGEVTSTMATREQLDAVVTNAKPVPRANLEADEIQDVYDPEVIIGTDILNLVPIREWQEKVRHNEGIQIPSRFVALRVNAIASNDEAEMRLRVLRYFSFVLMFYLTSKPGRQKGTRQVPQRDKLRELLDPAPEAVIENIRRKFSDAGVMRKFHLDLLMTHCCVYACIVDNFEVDTQNLRDDLRIDPKTMNQYFHEIGARVRPVTNKTEGRTTTIARLTLPLNLPKQRHMVPRR